MGTVATLSGDVPVVGDWDGNGTTTIGIRRDGQFHLRNTNTSGIADVAANFGAPRDVPLAGDWDGNGTVTIGVWRLGTFFLRNTNSTGPTDIVVVFGDPDDVPIVGDWDGDGITTVGVWREGQFLLRNTNTTGVAETAVVYGDATDLPVVGDWDGNGTTTVGVARLGRFLLRNTNTSGTADLTLLFGDNGDVPLAGDWDGNGTSTVGVRRGTTFFLRNTNTTGIADLTVPYGAATVVSMPPVGALTWVAKESPGFPGGGKGEGLLKEIRVGAHLGFERVVFELRDPASPAFRVSYVNVVAGPSGMPIPVPGTSALAVIMTPASEVDQTVVPPLTVYTGPASIGPLELNSVAGLVRYEDVEGVLGWAIGTNGQPPFAVSLLQNPTRLVVDIWA